MIGSIVIEGGTISIQVQSGSNKTEAVLTGSTVENLAEAARILGA